MSNHVSTSPEAGSADSTREDDLATAPGGSGRRFGAGMLALAMVTGLLVGFAAAMLVLGGPDGSGGVTGPSHPGDTSAEAGFTRDMINHHAQAVEMGLIAYDRAELPGVRQVAYDIATAQQGEIGTMHQWLREWDLLPTGSEPPMTWMEEDFGEFPGDLMPGMASAEQMRELREAEGTEVDRLFLELMITHHLGGIHMVDGVLDRSDHPDVTWLAGLMKTNQQAEISVLQGLQERLAESS